MLLHDRRLVTGLVNDPMMWRHEGVFPYFEGRRVLRHYVRTSRASYKLRPFRVGVIDIILCCNYIYQILLCRISSSFVMCSACRACPFTDLQPAIISSAGPVVYFAAYKTRPTGTCMVYFHKHFINDRKINAEPRICLTGYCE